MSPFFGPVIAFQGDGSLFRVLQGDGSLFREKPKQRTIPLIGWFNQRTVPLIDENRPPG